MLEPLVPTDEQWLAILRMAQEQTRAAASASDTGVGKTLIAVELAKQLKAQTILVIAPVKGPVISSWKSTFKRQGVDLPFVRIDSSPAGRLAFDNLKASLPGVYFVGREFFGTSGSNLLPTRKKDGTFTPGREALWSWTKVKPDLAVFDEVQVASNRKSNTFAVLKSLSAGYKLAQSATPAGNRFAGIWPITRWLWPKERDSSGELYVDNSFWRWAAQWAIMEYDPHVIAYNGAPGKKVMGEQVPGAFVSSLPCYIRIEATRLPVVERNVYVELTPVQRRLYDQMERDALAWLGDHPLTADIPIVKRIRMRQITLGEPVMVDNGRVDDDGLPLLDVDFAEDSQSSKIDALHKIIALHPWDPMLILLDSKKFAKVVASRIGGSAWTGDTSDKERNRLLAEFGKSVKYIVATIPAIAEGTDMLQAVCNIEVWMSKSLNNMLNLQCEGRLNRQGSAFTEIISYNIKALKTDDDNRFQDLVNQTLAMRASLTKG